MPGHEDQNYIQLDVFHHLHCLNMIRLMLWAGRSPDSLYLNTTHLGDTEEERMGHVDHCVDQIRQYLMCHADTTPLVWQWSERNKKYLTYMGMKHTCRDWTFLRTSAKGPAHCPMPPSGILQITNRCKQHQWLLLFSIAYSGSWPENCFYEIHEQGQNGQRTMT